MTETPTEVPEGYSLEHGWRTLALAGGAVGLVGILAIALPFVTGLSVTIGLGALLVVAGIVHGVHTFTARGWRGSLWQAALAVVSVVAGLMLLVNPLVGLATLTILLVAYLLVDGLAELWMAVRMADQPGRAAIALSGLVSLVLAGLIWAGFPTNATWALGLLVGVGILVTGVSMVTVAYTGRKLEAGAPAGEPRRA
ncbi:HdeD family acid-resistance protein [Natrarchaeobaculum aegyptiacum]|uniref:HdeD family acid-resistance protein n=1 Tax=Natrarchaeobaculum aegyptiacum TaxID=745377 RepID=A0A2Z2HQP1_9EURY|nr:DUF308 domain-containing protein [Natrarchaeobaculum aegyptiacum]ARS89476.1 hypothetical protein B1756_06765 [Natrarchaeobaculum aegyptiacum]